MILNFAEFKVLNSLAKKVFNPKLRSTEYFCMEPYYRITAEKRLNLGTIFRYSYFLLLLFFFFKITSKNIIKFSLKFLCMIFLIYEFTLSKMGQHQRILIGFFLESKVRILSYMCGDRYILTRRDLYFNPKTKKAHTSFVLRKSQHFFGLYLSPVMRSL